MTLDSPYQDSCVPLHEDDLDIYRSLVDSLPLSIYRIDLQGRLTFVNRTLLEQLGCPLEAVAGKCAYDFYPAELARKYRNDDARVAATGEMLRLVEENRNPATGQTRHVEVIKIPVHDQNGSIVGIQGVFWDITERKAAEEKLQLAASVFSAAREGIIITDERAVILDVNQAFTQITGYAKSEALGQRPSFLSSGQQSHTFYQAMWGELRSNGHWQGEIWNRRKNGEVYAQLLTISAVRDEQGKTSNYVGLFTDITPLKLHESQLEQIAHYDAVTGLPNRVLLSDRLHLAMIQAQRRTQQLAVAYLDLDGFKEVNDRHGHEVGDRLLSQLAIRMKQTLREGDTIARLGGDEFVAVFMDLEDSAAAIPLLGRLLGACAQPAFIGDLRLQVSASIGVTHYPQSEEVDADQLLRQADQAMYQAKLAGKNRYHIFDPEYDRSLRGHHESLEGIQQALLERQFVLHYQPKVNMRSGEVIGVEALIRWQHPQKGLLAPGLFLPVIEEHPLMAALGEWVIDQALFQQQSWVEQGLNIPVSVNIGAYQLQQHDFIARLQLLLEAHPGFQADNLQLEVLETSALQDMTHVARVTQACRSLGIGIALDDFGTGYSSLTYLKRLPADVLKIDQSFVRDMLEDPDDLAILEGVLGLAAAFRRQAIAEGVETVEHGEMLLQLGCELAQGYAIARPMAAQELPDWIGRWRPHSSWSNIVPISRNALPLLFARVDHRAWMHDIEECLKGARLHPPPLDPHQCRFGHWLHAEGAHRFSSNPDFQSLDQTHQRLHQLANDLLDRQVTCDANTRQQRHAELRRVSGILLAQLQQLIDSIG